MSDTSTPEKRRSSGRVFQVRPEEIQTPWLAWPTVGLGIASPLLWLWSFCRILEGQLSYSVLSFVACFVCFTPTHDASHWAIGRTTPLARLVNETIGRINVIPLLSPFPAFRHVHLLHHKHTNDPERDPDFFSQGGLWNCFLQEFYYYYYLFKHYNQVPALVWLESLLMLAGTVWGVAYGAALWGWQPMVFGVLLPQRAAVIYLAYCFDYVPHNEAHRQDHGNPYLVTKRITNFFGTMKTGTLVESALRLVVLNQDAHIIHHLYPTVPFYKYHSVWKEHEKEFYHAGVQKTSLF